MNEGRIERALGNIHMKDDMKKRLIEDCGYARKTKQTTRLVKTVVYTAVACMLVFMVVIGIPYLRKNMDGDSIVEFSGTITAVAMGSDGLDVETMMAVDQEIIMVFRPSSSALLPGLPFTFNFADCEIEISVNSGRLFEYTDESKIIEHGELYRADNKKTIIWSPLSGDIWEENGIAQRCDMTFDVYSSGERIGTGSIAIRLLKEDDEFFNEYPQLIESHENKWSYYYRVTFCKYTGSGQIGRSSQYGGAMVGDETMLVEPIDAENIRSIDLLEMPNENIIQTCSQAEIQEFVDAYNNAMFESDDIGTTHPLAVKIAFTDGTTMTVLGGTQGFSTVGRNGEWFNVNGAALNKWFKKRLP